MTDILMQFILQRFQFDVMFNSSSHLTFKQFSLLCLMPLCHLNSCTYNYDINEPMLNPYPLQYGDLQWNLISTNINFDHPSTSMA